MLVFMDESGDCGLKFDRGSSQYFVVVATIFRDAFSAGVCDRSIDELRRKLSIPSGFEFHFTKCRDSLRTKFLECVARENWCYYAFVLNKPKLFAPKFKDPDVLYCQTAEWVCSNARHLFEDAKVTIDKTGDREFRRRLEKALRSSMTDPSGRCRIRKIAMEESHLNNLVQLADMVCGAVARDYNGDRSPAAGVFRRLITRQEARVQFWPTK